MSCEHNLPSDMGYGIAESWDAEMEAEYQEHVALEGSNQWNANPDGCFFCGCDHHSDCCPERFEFGR